MTTISINFKRWSVAVNNKEKWGRAYHRIYLKKYIWTPFVLVKWRILKSEENEK